MTFAEAATQASPKQSAGRACRVKIRIAPAYTWLCKLVQALLAIGLVQVGQKAQIIRYLLQKTSSDAFRDYFEWK